ncbi:hypothetical protein M9H77_09035 [Catharanthus roseus]|uniref:Uncharacterized protein n=1 Tax=Catharanthus roseus TaxID=4058 RepID=A0ACC0BZJ4_CATRO|nr:hypothetical protein M9H77_09035 [Catharanthus roseus]
MNTIKFSYSLLLHLSLYALLSFSTVTKQSPPAVLDADGHQLQPGSKYYIIPFHSGNGGGLALSSKDIPCPFYVMQENLEASNGLPLRFLPANSTQQTITLSSDLNIVFNAGTICVQSTAWKVGGVDGKTGQRYVMSNGVIGNPGEDTLSSWFKIEKMGNGYKIVFCPSVCSFCKVVCGNLGVFREDGIRWLGLNHDDPLVILFKKA